MLHDLEPCSGFALERYLLKIADQAQIEGDRDRGSYAIARIYAMLDARTETSRKLAGDTPAA